MTRGSTGRRNYGEDGSVGSRENDGGGQRRGYLLGREQHG